MTHREKIATDGGIKRSADFSPCETYRYTLIREWDDSLPRLLFVLLNPSTADAVNDDPTNRRGMGFARQWGYGSCVFVNLFAYRTPNPDEMKLAADPVGSNNDTFILAQAYASETIVAAWGSHGPHRGRSFEVRRLLKNFKLYCLGKTNAGEPKHPLYLAAKTKLQTFTNAGEL